MIKPRKVANANGKSLVRPSFPKPHGGRVVNTIRKLEEPRERKDVPPCLKGHKVTRLVY